MIVKIDSDVFDICNRIKSIDSDYFIVYNLDKNTYEIHNYKNTPDTYSLTIPYSTLDKRTIDIVLMSDIKNIDTIVKDVDKNNEKIINKIKNNISDMISFKVNDIYKYASSTTKDYRVNESYKTEWF